MNFGDRHVLPIYPFLLLLAAGTWMWAVRRRVGLALLLLIATLQVADGLRYAPNYLSYFNPFIAPEDTWHLLADSNVDWGQGLLALRNYEQAHPEETIHIAYFGSVHPATYGLHARRLELGQRVSGTVVVSAALLSGYRDTQERSIRWVLQYPRKTILNHSLHVFEVPADAAPPAACR